MRRLPDFRLETFFSCWEFNARFNLAASDAESITVGELLAMADAESRAVWDELRLGYTETFGAPALRREIASTYEHISPEDVLCFAGAEEGIYCAMTAMLEPGDHAIVVVPNYQSLQELPLALCDVNGIALDEANGWALDVDAVHAALRPNTRLIVVNFPHNPTGRIIPRADFVALAELAAANDIVFFSDEVYRGLERDPATRLPQAADLSPSAMSLGVMSKAYGLAGLRIGWIACRDRAVLSRMERVKHYLSICNSAPSEALALIALRSRDRILERTRGIVAANIEMLNVFFEEWRNLFEWYVPDGGCTGYPRYLGDDGVEEFCRAAVEEAGVLLLPGSVYASPLAPTASNRFRIGFGRRNVAQALAALGAHLHARRAGAGALRAAAAP
jgi:aspartate/methionine/tyrosine aminotransferase